MIGSLFIPWIEAQFGPSLVPWDAIKSLMDLDPELRAQMFDRAPPAELVTFGLSFVAAALFVLTAAGSRLLALLAGALPFVTVGILFSRAGRASNGLGGDLPSFTSDEFSQQLSDFLGIAGPGLTLWFGSATVLLLVALVFRPSRAR